MLNNLHLIRPYWLLALIPLIFFVWYFYKHQKPGQNWRAVCDTALLNSLLQTNHKTTRRWSLALIAFLWLIAIIALAGPSWKYLQQPVYQKQTAAMIVLDLSPNMYATDVTPSRWARAQYKTLDILQHYREGSIGLIVFSQYPYVVSPLTQDSNTIISLVKELSPQLMPSSGDNMAAGLNKAQELFTQANIKNGNVLLITASNPNAAAYDAAKTLHAKGSTLSILAVGNATGAPLPMPNGNLLQTTDGSIIISQVDTRALKTLAQQGGGQLINLRSDNQDIEQLLQMTNTQQIVQSKEQQQTILWEDKAYYLLILIIPFVLLGFRRGWFERLVP